MSQGFDHVVMQELLEPCNIVFVRQDEVTRCISPEA